VKEIHTEIDIQASPERVWEILTDFDSYPEWNPFIRRISGKAEAGARLKVYLRRSFARGIFFRSTILKAEPNRELCWLGRLVIPGLFEGKHAFIIVPLEENWTHFIQHEYFTGLLVPMLERVLDTDIRRGFKEMNHALKERAEKNIHATKEAGEWAL